MDDKREERWGLERARECFIAGNNQERGRKLTIGHREIRD